MPHRESDSLAARVLQGDIRAAARLITLIEEDSPQAFDALDLLHRHTGKAHVVGITGAPGVGKSTLTSGLIDYFRRYNATLGIIAIDPTSAISGGAVLGDRIRMQQHSADPAVFIRSLATRGGTGGLARAAIGAIRIMDALGKDIILVETVGSGQLETDIVKAADTSLLVMAPGAGDEIQTMKAGILETVHIFVVNKADKEGADQLKIYLEAMPERRPGAWRPSVLLTDALSGRGVERLAASIQRHHEYLETGGQIEERRRERAKLELLTLVTDSLKDMVDRFDEDDYLNKLLNDFLAGKTGLHSAYLKIIERLPGELDKTSGGGKDGI
jgi:LAO/AO transport system kinase